MDRDNPIWDLIETATDEEVAAWESAVKKRIQELEDRYNELVEKADE